MVLLSKRLQKIADKVNTGAIIADVGTDHALLPVSLVQRGLIRYAVAGELNEGPLQAAKKQVGLANVSDRVHVRQGDGLDVLHDDEVDTIIIAGMGGALISSILNKGNNKLNNVRRLILQPNVAEENVRRWLHDHGWFLIDEEMVKEDGNIYEILVAERDSGEQSNQLYEEWRFEEGTIVQRQLLFQMGPYFVRQPSLIFIEKWERELRKIQYVLKQLADGDVTSAEVAERKRSFQFRFQQIEEVIHASKRTLNRTSY